MADHDGLSSFYKSWCFALLIFLALFFATSIGSSQEVSPTISVTVNKSLVFRLAQKARRVSVTQPEVAEVVVVAPTQLLINGKSVGTTSLVLWDEKGEVTNFDLIVAPDVAALRRQLSGLFPQEKIDVSTSGPSIVLKGEVSNEVVYDKVLETVLTYLPPKPKEEVAPPSQAVTVTTRQPRLPATGTAFAGGGQLAFVEEASLSEVNRFGDKRRIPGIIDLLVIKEIRQIELDVIVAEVALSKLREIGLDFTVFTRKTSVRSDAGSQGGFPTRLLEGISPASPGGVVDINPLTFGDATSAIFNHVGNRFQIAALFRLFQNRDITEILAQPRLVMKNGRSGGFLAGGEFPLAVLGQENVEIEFKPFGVRLDFVPTITWSDTIDLRVFPEVSEIDTSVERIAGIPGLKVRRSVNRVEMKEGETLVIGGLLDRRIFKDVTKFPILGDVPILGALFRSTRFRNQESELVFVITPRIVRALKPGQKPQLPSSEKYDDSDIRQVPLPNSSGSGASMSRPSAQGPTMP